MVDIPIATFELNRELDTTIEIPIAIEIQPSIVILHYPYENRQCVLFCCSCLCVMLIMVYILIGIKLLH